MNDKIKQLTSNYLANFNADPNLYSWENLDSATQQKLVKINSQNEWIIFNASSLKAKRVTGGTRVPSLKVDENDLVISDNKHYGMHIRRYLDKFGDQIGLVGEYYLGNSRSANGEMEKEPMNNYDDRTVWRKFVWGRVRNQDGTVSSQPVPLLIQHQEDDFGFSPEAYEIVDPLLKEICQEALKIYYPTNDPNSLDADALSFYGGDGDSVGTNSATSQHLRTRPAIKVDYFEGKGNKSCWVAINKAKMPENGYEYDESTIILNRAHWKKSENINELLNDNEIINSREREVETPLSNNNPAEENSPNNQPPNTQTIQIQFKIKSTWRDDLEPDVNFFSITLESPITVNENQVNLIEITGRKANTAYQNGDLRTGNTITITNVKLSPFKAIINDYKELSIGKNYEEIQVVSSTSPSPDSPPSPAFFPEVRQKNQELPDQEREMTTLTEELLKMVEKNQEVCQEIRKFGLRPLEISNDALLYFQEEFFTELNEELALDSSINREISDHNERIRQKKLSIKKGIYRILNNNKQRLLEEKNKEHNPPPKPEAPDRELKETRKQVGEEINKLLNSKSSLQNIELNMLLTNGKYQNWEEEIEQLSTKEEILTYQNAFLKVLKRVGVGENKNNISNASTLKAARNIAEERIREALKKNNVKPENLRSLWVGSKTWQGHLEKLKDKKQIDQFVQALERKISQTNDKSSLTEPTNIPIIFLIIFALPLLAVIGLAITKILWKKNNNYN